MTIYKLEIMAYATHHDDPLLFPTKKEAAMYCDDGEEPLALIRLSDYEALQAEFESLKEYAELGKAVQQKREPGKRYGCHCDLEEGMEPDGCVIDEGNRHQCIYAKRISAKEQCEYWRVIVSDVNQER